MRDPSSFYSLLRERAESIPGDRTDLRLLLHGYSVNIRFFGIAPTETMLENLRLLMPGDGGEKTLNAFCPEDALSETVSVFEDDLSFLCTESMLPANCHTRPYHRTNTFRILYPGMTRRLAVRDETARRTWIVFDRGGAFPIAYVNKPFVNEIQWWLGDRCLLLHGAGTGIGGRGALILGGSGAGKSTLALSCLCSGMDYLADDYILVSGDGPVRGYPIFNTGYLTPRSLDMLPALRDDVLFYSEEKDKSLISLSPRHAQIRPGMPLSVIIYPRIGGGTKPSLRRAGSVEPFVEALTSTAKQIKYRHFFKDSFMTLFSRLSSLPAYEMTQCEDPVLNAETLRRFLESLPGNNNGTKEEAVL